MALIVPIRSNNAYIGIGKQTTSGVAVAPTLFPRWLDGTKYEIAMKEERILEGDGTRRASQVIKNQQTVKITLVCSPRPIEVGFLETAALGASSDAVTAASVATTLSSASIVGATSISVAANTGLTGVSPIALVLGAGTASEEIALFAPPVTGAGPYTLNVASSYNGGNGLKLAHASASTVGSPTTHVVTDQLDGNYYTVEVGLGSLNSANGGTLRVRDCKVDSIKRSAKAGQLLMYEVQFVGIASTVQGSPSTVTLEAHNPYYYDTGVWTLDGATTGDATEIDTFTLEQKNNLDTGIQTEQLILDASIYGALQVTLTADVVFTSMSRLYNIYFGSPTGTTDTQAIGTGSLNLVFSQVDSFHTLAYNIQTLHYVKGGWPVPKADGKHYKVSFEGESVSNQGVNTYILQTTVGNTRTTIY